MPETGKKAATLNPIQYSTALWPSHLKLLFCADQDILGSAGSNMITLHGIQGIQWLKMEI